MKKTKWAVSLLSIILTVNMLFSTTSASAATSFTDVGSQYKDAVDFLVEKGATSGKTATLFGTYDNITRVDAAVLLAKLLDLNTDVENSNFTDVPARGVKYVNALKAAGITSGKTAITFDSYATITRGELAIWIQRAFNLEGSNSVSFTDVSSRYVEAVSALVANNITQGYSSTSFGTTDKATRGQYALFLYRASKIELDEASVLQKKVNEIINNIIKPGMTDLERCYAIYRYMIENVDYDFDYERYTAYDALIEGLAVCQGYAEATDILMEEAEVDSLIIRGYIGKIGHAWNLVKVNGHYYHIDTTNSRFLENDKQIINANRVWWHDLYPKSIGKQVYQHGYDFFVKANDIYYTSSYKQDYGVLKLLKIKPDGTEEAVTTLEPDGGILSYEDNWIYYGSRSNDGKIYRKNLSNYNTFETIVYNNDYDYSLDNFSIRDGWIYIIGDTSTADSIIRINPETMLKETLLEIPINSVPSGKTYEELWEMTVADEWIYYTIQTRLQETDGSSSMITEKFYKMKHDGSKKTFIRKRDY